MNAIGVFECIKKAVTYCHSDLSEIVRSNTGNSIKALVNGSVTLVDHIDRFFNYSSDVEAFASDSWGYIRRDGPPIFWNIHDNLKALYLVEPMLATNYALRINQQDTHSYTLNGKISSYIDEMVTWGKKNKLDVVLKRNGAEVSSINIGYQKDLYAKIADFMDLMAGDTSNRNTADSNLAFDTLKETGLTKIFTDMRKNGRKPKDVFGYLCSPHTTILKKHYEPIAELLDKPAKTMNIEAGVGMPVKTPSGEESFFGVKIAAELDEYGYHMPTQCKFELLDSVGLMKLLPKVLNGFSAFDGAIHNSFVVNKAATHDDLKELEEAITGTQAMRREVIGISNELYDKASVGLQNLLDAAKEMRVMADELNDYLKEMEIELRSGSDSRKSVANNVVIPQVAVSSRIIKAVAALTKIHSQGHESIKRLLTVYTLAKNTTKILG